jgi:hypothetical protein
VRRRVLRRSDIDRLEQEIPKNDPVADRTRRVYTRAVIAKLEEKHVPWLRRRRRR